MEDPRRRIEVLRTGYVELLDCYGGDQAVLRAARKCYDREDPKDPEADLRLIQRLLRSVPTHGSPFEAAVMVYDLKLPLFIRDQVIRHRMASPYVKSLRRCRIEDLEIYEPDGMVSVAQREIFFEATSHAFTAYRGLLDCGWRPEIARCVLPSGLYTEMLWHINCRSLMNYLEQRMDKHAQREHRLYAYAIAELWSDAMPLTSKVWWERRG